jgi:hypothetical protein
MAAGALALGGCGSDSDSDSVPSASSLVGTWNASAVGYGDGVLEGPFRFNFLIEKADDASQSFTGKRVVMPELAKQMDIPDLKFDGVITDWGEISIVGSGTATLELDGDEMTGRYLETGNDPTAKSLTLTRE